MPLHIEDNISHNFFVCLNDHKTIRTVFCVLYEQVLRVCCLWKCLLLNLKYFVDILYPELANIAMYSLGHLQRSPFPVRACSVPWIGAGPDNPFMMAEASSDRFHEFASHVFVLCNSLNDGSSLGFRFASIVGGESYLNLVTFPEVVRGERGKSDAGRRCVLYQHPAPLLGGGQFAVVTLKVSPFSVGSSPFKRDVESLPAYAYDL